MAPTHVVTPLVSCQAVQLILGWCEVSGRVFSLVLPVTICVKARARLPECEVFLIIFTVLFLKQHIKANSGKS